jgi:pimeloyl-ACP methyl ester carboxylesterase
VELETSKRRGWLLRPALGVALVVTGGVVAARSRPAEKRVVLGDRCHTPARVLGFGQRPSKGVVIIFHGLSASAAVMEPIGQSLAESGWRVYLVDLAGHGRSRERFSYAAAESCAAAAVNSLAQSGAIHPHATILLGHSLGAAIAVRLASRLPVAATIAISPALLALPPKAPPNLLVLTGQFDFSEVKQTAKALLDLAGGTRAGANDFTKGRAVELREMSWATHGGMILDPRVWNLAVEWSARSRAASPSAALRAGGSGAGADVLSPTPPADARGSVPSNQSRDSPRRGAAAQADVRRHTGAAASAAAPVAVARNQVAAPGAALLATFAMLAGLVLLVAPMETLLARACAMQAAGGAGTHARASGRRRPTSSVSEAPENPSHAAWKAGLVFWLLASFFSVSLLGLTRAVKWLRPVRMEGGDWAALVALATGLTLLALMRERLGETLATQPRARLPWRDLSFAALAGVAIVAAFAAALNPELVEIAVSGARLWRFAVLVAFTLPYFVAEEALLGSPAPDRGLAYARPSFRGRPLPEESQPTCQSPSLPSSPAHPHRGPKPGNDAVPPGAAAPGGRFALFLLLRGAVWLAQAFAVLVFWPSGLLMVLLVLELGIVAIGQRLAADALRRRGAGIPAAALFDAILAAGMLALMLPLT